MTNSLTNLVVRDGGVQLFPVNEWNSDFCCNAGAENSSYCTFATQNSNLPFTLTNGYPIFNRSDGSTSPNNTATASGPATTVTVTADGQMHQESKCHETTIGLGVGLPLGILLLVSIAALAWQYRQRKHFEHLAQYPVSQGTSGTYTPGNLSSSEQEYKPPAQLSTRNDQRAELSTY